MARGRPPKTLAELVRDGTFESRRAGHRERLLGPDLPWAHFAALQADYRLATVEGRRPVALEFQRAVAAAHEEMRRRAGGLAPSLAAELRALGRPDSFRQLERFFPRFLSHSAGPAAGKPFRLAPFQREFLREFWRRDSRGRRVYQVGLLGVPKGNGKTPLAAGLGLHALASETDSPEIYGVAGSRQQASLAHAYARAWVEEGDLRHWIRSGATLRCPETRGLYRVQSSDGRLGHGVQPSAALVDEWWLLNTARERESYNALAKALHKRPGRAWLLAITTAGFDLHSQLGETYQAAIEHPGLELGNDGYLQVLRDTKNGFLFWWHGPPPGEEPDPEDRKVIRACNPARWIQVRDLVRELGRPDTDELDWRRLHLNQWTRARDSWLPVGVWARRRDVDAQIPQGAEVYAGVDVGWSHDSTAVALAYKRADGRIVLQVKVWTTDPKAVGAYVAGGVMQLDLIEDYLRTVRRDYRLREVAYDPKFFGRSAQDLEREGIVMVEMLPQAAPMQHAWQSFYQAVIEGSITHDGDPVFAAHVDAAAAEKTEQGWKVRKLRSTARIDALAAAVMAHGRCQLMQQEPARYLITAADLEGR